MFCHSNKKGINTEFGIRSGAIATTGLTVLFLEEYGRIWDLRLVKQLDAIDKT